MAGTPMQAMHAITMECFMGNPGFDYDSRSTPMVLIKYDQSKPHSFDENQRNSPGDPQYAIDFAGLAEPG